MSRIVVNSKGEEALFEAALALPRDQRSVYLDQACAADSDLRRRLEALLQAHEQAGNFMAQPAAPNQVPPARATHFPDRP